MKKIYVLAVLALLTIILAACSGDKEEKKEENATDQLKVEIGDDEKVDDNEVVATINGEDILGDTYNIIYAQLKLMQQLSGQDISEKEKLKDEAIDMLIDQELLRLETKDKGIDVTKKEVQAKFDEAKSENEEQFKEILKQYYLTEEAFKEQLAFELAVGKYIDSEFPDIKVTDEEVKAYYDQQKEQNEVVPDFKEVEEQIKQGLQGQKEQEKLQSVVDKLKEKAKIDVKI